MTMTMAESSTLPRPIPERWIERLFSRFAAFYGAKFGDLWRGCDIDDVKQTWKEALSGYASDEIRRGLEACLSRLFPPTLPEFLALCRPPLDAKLALSEAIEQMARREVATDTWSHPAIFWAAVTLGAFDLRNGSWGTLERRWRKILSAEMAKGEWLPVQKRAPALPSPPGQARHEVVENAVSILTQKQKSAGNRDWAHKIIQREQAGELLPLIVVKMAHEVLGMGEERTWISA